MCGEFVCLFVRLLVVVSWFFGLVGLWVCWLAVCWFVGWLIGWLAGWLVDWFVRVSVCRFADLSAGSR